MKIKKLGAILLVFAIIATVAACAAEPPAPEPAVFATPAPTPSPTPEAVETTPEPEIVEEYPTEPSDLEAMAFETYSEIMQLLSMQDVESGAFDIDFFMEMYMSVLGESITSITTGDIQTIVDGEHVQMSMSMETDMSQFGLPPMVVEMYVELDGDNLVELRMIIDGEDVSEILTQEMLVGMVDDTIDQTFNMPEFDIDAFVSVEVEEANGYTIIHMLIDGDMLSDFAFDAMGEELSMLDELGIDMNMDVSDVLISIIVDRYDNPVTMAMELEMRMGFDGEVLEELDGEEIIIRMVSFYNFIAFGDSVEIVLPA